MMRAPSGEKAALFTSPACPYRTLISIPVEVSQTPAVWSSEEVTTRVPSGEKAAPVAPGAVKTYPLFSTARGIDSFATDAHAF